MHSATGNMIKWKKNIYNMHKGYVKKTKLMIPKETKSSHY